MNMDHSGFSFISFSFLFVMSSQTPPIVVMIKQLIYFNVFKLTGERLSHFLGTQFISHCSVSAKQSDRTF